MSTSSPKPDKPAEILKLRDYQQQVLKQILTKTNDHNTLVTIPTGAGKTFIAVILAKMAMRLHPHHCVVVLCPTVALVEQQEGVFLNDAPKLCDGEQFATKSYCAGKSPSSWLETCRQHDAIFLTPAVLQNALAAGKLEIFKWMSLLIFDECHNATGAHPYAEIMAYYEQTSSLHRPRVIGLTASPSWGVDPDKTETAIANLLGTYGAEICAADLKQVQKHISIPEVEIVEVDFSSLNVKVQEYAIEKAFVLLAEQLDSKGKRLQKKMQEQNIEDSSDVPLYIDDDLSSDDDDDVLTEADKVLETFLLDLLDKLFWGPGALRQLTKEQRKQLKQYIEEDDYEALKREMKDSEEKKQSLHKELITRIQESYANTHHQFGAIIFVRTRRQAELVAKELSEFSKANEPFNWIKVKAFLGARNRASDARMTQAQQRTTLNNFREGELNILVATSVAEEGLDIPTVSLVIRLDVTDEITTISMIQSRGRARWPESRYCVFCKRSDRVEKALRMEKRQQALVQMPSRLPSVALFDNNWLLRDVPPELVNKMPEVADSPFTKLLSGLNLNKPTPGRSGASASCPDGNFIGSVKEYCEQSRKPFPTFDSEKSGPPHLPTFTFVLNWEGKEYRGEPAGAKKQAKQNAFQKLWEDLIRK
eukprot:m.228943 g.228943  ORF g.228943 m.228943 type:complete len:649 (+) comp26432_c0_seq5:53-1999(+)